MANGSVDSPLLREEDATIADWDVPKLISFLKSTFRPKDFDRVEAVLVAREEKSKTEMQALKQQNDSMVLKFEREKSRMMELEEEIKRCRKGFEEMKNVLSKLRDENIVLRAREKSAEERCEKLLEDVKRIGEKDHELIDLRSRNCELEFAKSKAEDELKIMKRRFEELDRRVLALESDLSLLKDSNSNGVGVENGHSENGTAKADETMKVEELSVGPSCDSPVKANGHSLNAGSDRPPSKNDVEIVEIDSDDDCAEAEILSEKRSHSAENSQSDQICLQNGTSSLKRKQTSETENGDNVDNTSNGKVKMKKLQEPACQPDDCSLKHCSTTPISSESNEVNGGSATARADIMVSSLHEQKTKSQQNSQNLTNGFPLDGLAFLGESSCSSDSDSDSDSESDDPVIFSRSSQLAPETQRENRNLSSHNSDPDSDGRVRFARNSRLAPETQRENKK